MRFLLFFLLISPGAFSDVILCTGMSNAKHICADWRRNNTTEHQIINGGASSFNIVRIHDKPEEYWERVFSQIKQAGLTPADIDIIWNLNVTTAKSGDIITERQLVHDYFIWFQAVAEYLFPNLQAGYHSPRTLGQYCRLNPEPFASDIRNAILGSGENSGAITHFSKWHFGPDISAPEYFESDFTDGCHLTKSGFSKTTPIMNEFFGTTVYSTTHARVPMDAKSEVGSFKKHPVSATGPVVTKLAEGHFKVSWQGQGSILSCGGASFPVEGESHDIHVPTDLPFGMKNRCSIDKGPLSNRFGCRNLSECRAL